MKLRKVRGRSTSPEGRAVLHQAVDKSFVSGQELKWAEEGLCTTEDSQSATGFGGEVGNVTFPGKVMADSETQKYDYLSQNTQKTLTYLAPKSFNMNSGVQLSMEARSRVACESSLLLH